MKNKKITLVGNLDSKLMLPHSQLASGYFLLILDWNFSKNSRWSKANLSNLNAYLYEFLFYLILTGDIYFIFIIFYVRALDKGELAALLCRFIVVLTDLCIVGSLFVTCFSCTLLLSD